MVRSRPKSFSSAAASRSTSAWRPASAASSSSSRAAPRSSARARRPCHVSISERRPSASRRTFWAPRWSSQNPGSRVSASSCATRACFASRSKAPRGRPDPFGQIADGGRVHLVPGLQILEQDRTQLDEPQSRLAPSDDGVHAGAVAVVRTDAAVAVTVESSRVAAGPAIALARDEIDERGILGLLQQTPSIHDAGHERGWGLGDLPGGRERSRIGGLAQYRRPTPQRQGGSSGSARPDAYGDSPDTK